MVKNVTETQDQLKIERYTDNLWPFKLITLNKLLYIPLMSKWYLEFLAQGIYSQIRITKNKNNKKGEKIDLL